MIGRGFIVEKGHLVAVGCIQCCNFFRLPYSFSLFLEQRIFMHGTSSKLLGVGVTETILCYDKCNWLIVYFGTPTMINLNFKSIH